MTEEEKRAKEVPQKRRRFYMGGASLIAITVFIIILFTGGIAYEVQSLTKGKVEGGVLVGPLVGGEVREFRIDVQQWYYEPKIIKVRPGDMVRFILTSQDLTHGFAINELGINLAVSPGAAVIHEVWIPTDYATDYEGYPYAMAEGTYTVYCSIFCGMGHPYLKGNIIVSSPLLFFGVDIGKILPYIATSVMAGMFATFIIIIWRRRSR